MEDISKNMLSINNSSDDTDGYIIVNIQENRISMIKKERFTYYIYKKDFSPMCNNDVEYEFKRKGCINESIVIQAFLIWLPEKYLLLPHDNIINGSPAHINYEIDKSMNVIQQPLTM